MKDNSFFNKFGTYNQINNVPLPNALQQIKPQAPYQKNQQQGQQGYYHQGKQINNQVIKKQFTKHQLQQFQQFQKELEYEQQSQQQQKNQQQQQQQYQKPQLHHNGNQLYYPKIQEVNLYNPVAMHQFPPLYNIYEQPHIFQQFTIPMQPQPQMVPDVMLHYPPITTMTPMQHEVDWFYGKESWKMFDSRRCNLIENMMHHNTQSEFELVYRDSKCIVDFRAMTLYDTQEDFLYKLRRESPICSKMIRIGQGTWSFYNGLTWMQYDRLVIFQLEEKLRHGETHFSIYVEGKDYTFDLDQNVQVCDPLPLGKGDRKIITRQWMTMQQLQDIGRMKKHQEQVYIEERKKLEDRLKQHIIQKKALQTSMKQQQRQYWNQMKKSSHNATLPNLLSENFNINELDLGIGKNQPTNIFQDLPKINLTEGKVGQVIKNNDYYMPKMNQNFILQDLSIESIQSCNQFLNLQELDPKNNIQFIEKQEESRIYNEVPQQLQDQQTEIFETKIQNNKYFLQQKQTCIQEQNQLQNDINYQESNQDLDFIQEQINPEQNIENLQCQQNKNENSDQFQEREQILVEQDQVPFQQDQVLVQRDQVQDDKDKDHFQLQIYENIFIADHKEGIKSVNE